MSALPRLIHLDWLPVWKTIEFKVAVFAFKILAAHFGMLVLCAFPASDFFKSYIQYEYRVGQHSILLLFPQNMD